MGAPEGCKQHRKQWSHLAEPRIPVFMADFSARASYRRPSILIAYTLTSGCGQNHEWGKHGCVQWVPMKAGTQERGTERGTEHGTEVLAAMFLILQPAPFRHPMHTWCTIFKGPCCETFTSRPGDCRGQPTAELTDVFYDFPLTPLLYITTFHFFIDCHHIFS